MGLKAAGYVNYAAGFAQNFGFSLPHIDSKYFEMALNAVGNFGVSNVREYDVLQSRVDALQNGYTGRTPEQLRGDQLHELAEFLRSNDLERKFSGLRKVTIPGAKDGICTCWTTPEGWAAIEAELQHEQTAWEAKALGAAEGTYGEFVPHMADLIKNSIISSPKEGIVAAVMALAPEAALSLAPLLQSHLPPRGESKEGELELPTAEDAINLGIEMAKVAAKAGEGRHCCVCM
jgi:hypothetical protein